MLIHLKLKVVSFVSDTCCTSEPDHILKHLLPVPTPVSLPHAPGDVTIIMNQLRPNQVSAMGGMRVRLNKVLEALECLKRINYLYFGVSETVVEALHKGVEEWNTQFSYAYVFYL